MSVDEKNEEPTRSRAEGAAAGGPEGRSAVISPRHLLKEAFRGENVTTGPSISV
jgi:predicted pyridoxine 5'-phosphate oxidase superfamily flavin-nucleotide-binding protein